MASKRIKVMLFASELAALIGMMPFKDQTPAKAFIKTFSRIFPSEYEKGKRESKAEEDSEKAKRLLEKTGLDSKPVIGSIEQKDVEKVRESFEKFEVEVKKRTDITDDEKDTILRNVRTKANKTFGLVHEASSLQERELRTGIPLSSASGLRGFKCIRFDSDSWGIGGKIDGKEVSEEGRGIEIKNRMKELFKTVPDYERVQVHVYMCILKAKIWDLEQHLRIGGETKTSTLEVKWDSEFWDQIVSKSRVVVEKLNVLAQDEKLLVQYLKADDAGRDKIFMGISRESVITKES
jgi:hypothetical protein